MAISRYDSLDDYDYSEPKEHNPGYHFTNPSISQSGKSLDLANFPEDMGLGIYHQKQQEAEQHKQNLHQFIQKNILKLTKREREVIELKYKGQIDVDIGNQLKISRTRVAQLFGKARKKLRQLYEEELANERES